MKGRKLRKQKQQLSNNAKNTASQFLIKNTINNLKNEYEYIVNNEGAKQ